MVYINYYVYQKRGTIHSLKNLLLHMLDQDLNIVLGHYS